MVWQLRIPRDRGHSTEKFLWGLTKERKHESYVPDHIRWTANGLCISDRLVGHPVGSYQLSDRLAYLPIHKN
ncbi:hypothetical protein GCM10028826_18880 [Mucilaginibacter boryungensis]